MDSKRLLQFLTKLKKNNNREWFEKNRKEYEELREGIVEFVERMLKNVQAFDPSLADQQPKNSMFRINRDIRFSNDKSPYKTNVGLSFSKGGKSSPYAGYYLHIEPGELFIGGGSWAPLPEHLAAIRQEIDYHFDEFKKIISSKDFKKYFEELEGEKLTRLPKGYEAENPAAEYIKHKSFLMGHRINEKQLADKDFEKYLTKVFKAMKPLIDFLNRAMG